MTNTKYIHYGHKEFDINKFNPIKNRMGFPKPFGGLWASDINTSYGWKDWNKDNDFVDCDIDNSFTFELRDDANVFHIHHVTDLKKTPHKKPYQYSSFLIDFEKMKQNGFDAIELHLSEDWDLYYELYGWDCDSILIMNPDIVIPCREEVIA